MEILKIKLNANLRGYKKGDIVSVATRNGKISDVYWQRRLLDLSVEFVSVEKPSLKKTKKDVKE